MKFKVEVKELGRSKVNKSVEVDKIDYDNLYRVVKPHLLSDLIDFIGVIEGKWGIVRVGMMRPVGKIRFIKIKD